MVEAGWAVQLADFLDAHAKEFYPDAVNFKKCLNVQINRMTKKGLITKNGEWLHEPLDM
jgi:hypothetical protein